MALPLIYDNAIAWSQLRLRRGWKNVIATTLAYFAILAGSILATTRVKEFGPPATVLDFWTNVLLWIQTATLLLFGCLAVGGAVRKDITSKMIESHRLMNVSGLNAMLGYLLGATVQVTPIALVNLVIGLFTAQGAGLPQDGWLMCNVLLVGIAVMMWLVVIVISTMTAAGTTLLVIAGLVALLGHEVIPELLPGLNVLASPVSGTTLIGLLRQAAWPSSYTIALSAQGVLAVVCLIAAARKYRREDIPAFGVVLGLALLAIWIGLTVLGINNWEDFRPPWMRYRGGDLQLPLIVGLLVCILLAIVPVAAAARSQVNWNRRRGLNDPGLGPRPVPTDLVVVTSVAMAMLLPFLLLHDLPIKGLGERVINSSLTFFAFVLATSYLIRTIYLTDMRARYLVGMWLVAWWAGPFVLDLIYLGWIRGVALDEPELSEISAVSPIGTLAASWTSWEISVVPGLIAQGAIAALCAVAFYMLQPRAMRGLAARAGVKK